MLVKILTRFGHENQFNKPVRTGKKDMIEISEKKDSKFILLN